MLFRSADRLAQSDTVRFLGAVDEEDLPGLYAAATFFVFPSRYEGFGLPVLEAMACGTPVVCSNSSSLPEIAGQAALMFDPNDETAIRGALAQAMEDTALRNNLAEDGLERSRAFSWQRTARQTLDVYRGLLR